MKTFLIPTDISQESANAIKIGVKMAQKFDYKIILLNVVEGAGEQWVND